MTISPWSADVRLLSPDGSLVAEISDAMEIAMGGPMEGTLHISNDFIIERCNSSIVWSEDSRYLAVPQWVHNRKQRLVVIEPLARKLQYFPGIYRVLEIHQFKNGIISATDSPPHLPRSLEFNLSDLKPPNSLHTEN